MKRRLPCRCRHCGARRNLTKWPLEYKILPKCLCGKRDYRVDNYRMKKEWKNKKNKCSCHGYWFPHAKGRGMCIHNETNSL